MTALEIRGTENINFSGMHYATIMCFLCFFFFLMCSTANSTTKMAKPKQLPV